MSKKVLHLHVLTLILILKLIRILILISRQWLASDKTLHLRILLGIYVH